MIRRFRILSVISVSTVLGGLAYVALRPHEPMHQGKSVTFWIRSLTNNPPATEEGKDALKRIGLPALPYLVAAFERKNTAWSRIESKLRQIAPSATAKLLPEPFPWEAIRTTVADTIGSIGQGQRFSDGMGDGPTTRQLQRAVRALARGLTDANASVRVFSAQALAFIGPNARDAVPELVKLLDQGDSHEKIMVCQAFGTIGPCPSGFQAVEALLRALTASDRNLNISATYALGGMGRQAAPAVPVLVARLANDDEPTRRASIRALAHIGNLPKDLRPKILPFLSETNDATRAGAAIALAGIDPNDKNAISVARECLAAEKPANVRISTVILIIGMGSSAVAFLPELEKLADDSDLTVATYARKALKQIRRETVTRTGGK